MSKPRIYIAGKVTGLPMEEVWHRFMAKETELLAQGYEVMNPVRMVAEQLNGGDDSWENIMRFCIQVLMSCDAIYVLVGWEDSAGARIEKRLAEELSFDFQYEAKGTYTPGTIKEMYVHKPSRLEQEYSKPSGE